MTWTKLERTIDVTGQGFLVGGFLEDAFLAGPDGSWTKIEKVTDQ